MGRLEGKILLMGLWVSAPGWAAGGSTVGSGGDAIHTESGWHVLDSLEYKNEFVPFELPSYVQTVAPRLEALKKKLPKTAVHLESAFHISQRRWYFAEYQLQEIEDEGEVPIGLTYYDKQQLAITTPREVFVRKAIWDTIPSDERGYALVHEALWITLNPSTNLPGNTIRKLAGRILSRYNYLLTSTQLGDELLDILGETDSILAQKIRADIEDSRDAPVLGNLRGFLTFCAAEKWDFLVSEMVFQATGTRTLTRERCKKTYRHFFRTRELRVEGRLGSLIALTYFPMLESISLIQTQVSDLVPLASVDQLRELILHSNDLTNADLIPLNDLEGLRVLSLKDNEIETTEGLDFTRLRHLDLSENFLTSETLFLPDTLDRLEVLNLSGNLFSNPDTLTLSRRFPQLKELDLSNNNIKDFLPDGIPEGIVKISLAGNLLSRVPVLRALRSLDYLDLSGNSIDDVASSHVPESLGVLDLSDNHLRKLTWKNPQQTLNYLDLSRNEIRTLPEDIGHKLPRLRSLLLNGNPGVDVDSLASLSKLRTLELDDVNLVLGNLPIGLRNLSIAGNDLTSIESLQGLTHLESLDVSNNLLRDIEPLSQLASLRDLDVSQNLGLHYPEYSDGRLRSLQAGGSSLKVVVPRRAPVSSVINLILKPYRPLRTLRNLEQLRVHLLYMESEANAFLAPHVSSQVLLKDDSIKLWDNSSPANLVTYDLREMNLNHLATEHRNDRGDVIILEIEAVRGKTWGEFETRNF